MAWSRNEMAQRAALELENGFYVNLGIGIPTLVANYVRTDISVEFQSENGVLGMGPFPYEGEEDADYINAGKQTITTVPGSAIFDSAMSFGMIRARKVDLTRIESRPRRDLSAGKTYAGQYRFYLDAVGHIADDAVGEALRALHRNVESVVYLGSWPAETAVGSPPPDTADSVRWFDGLTRGEG